MNIDQANTQARLSKNEPLGSDSSVNKNPRVVESSPNEEQVGGVQSSASGDGKVNVSKMAFFVMIVAASILDLSSALLNLIPVVGGGAADIIIWLPGTVIFFLAYLKLGVGFGGKNTLKLGGCDVVKLIPVLNALPTFLLSVFLTLGPSAVKNLPGGEVLANKVQQSMSVVNSAKKE